MTRTLNYSRLKHVMPRTNQTITFAVATINYYAHVGALTNVIGLIVHNCTSYASINVLIFS